MHTSALLKLVKDDEAEGPALRDYIAGTAEPRLVSSALLTVEARRGMLRVRPDGLPKLDLLLADVALIGISDAIVENASRLPIRAALLGRDPPGNGPADP